MRLFSRIELNKLFFSAKAIIRYWLTKEDRFSQQSPFVFQFYSELLGYLKANPFGDEEIELYRRNLLENHALIQVTDLGAGSKKVPFPFRKISDITRHSTSGPKFGQIYRFFCSKTPGNVVIELGTCMGISTRYLATSTKGTLYTIEGSEAIWQEAQNGPTVQNTQFILGPIKEKLPQLLKTVSQVDFVLLDAHHTYRATMEAFYSLLPKAHSQTIFAVADIHWTAEMEQAWEEICACPQVRLTFDFFECGIVFFDYKGEKNHLTLAV